MAVDWIGNYLIEWQVNKIDPASWTIGASVGGVKSFKFNTNGMDDVPLLQSGSITMDSETGDIENGWYQIVGKMIGQNGDVSLVPLFSMLMESDTTNFDYGIGSGTLNGKSVLYPVNKNHMQVGEFLPKGSDGAEWCRRMIGRFTPAPVSIEAESNFTLNRHFVFDSNTSYLKAVWSVLDAAGWVIRIDGSGNIKLGPKPSTPTTRFEREALGLFTPGIDRTLETSDVPNAYYAYYNGEKGSAENRDPDSIVSIPRRGYINDVVDTDPKLINGETIDHYCTRMLRENSVLMRTYTYSRSAFEPIYPFDMVYINVPGVFNGDARILTQAYSFENKRLTIQEMVGEEVRLWQA